MNNKVLVSNLNNSLVFYRRLFGVMPIHMNLEEMRFEKNGINYQIVESNLVEPSDHIITVEDINDLYTIYHRMKLNSQRVTLLSSCYLLENKAGFIDLDNNRWLVALPETELSPFDDTIFEQCPIEIYK
jgi:hypothetical protein